MPCFWGYMSCFWSQNQKNNKNNIKFLGTNIFLAAGGNLVSFSILVRFELISSTQRACSLQHVFAFVGNSVYMRFHYTERVSIDADEGRLRGDTIHSSFYFVTPEDFCAIVECSLKHKDLSLSLSLSPVHGMIKI